MSSRQPHVEGQDTDRSSTVDKVALVEVSLKHGEKVYEQ